MRVRSKSQAGLETLRKRCPKHGTLLNIHTGRCVLYDHYPSETREDEPVLAAISKAQVEVETGGQLTLPGLPPISRVPVVWKPYWEMSRREFLDYDWRLEEDDRMTVRVKDGIWQVTVTRKGVTE